MWNTNCWCGCQDSCSTCKNTIFWVCWLTAWDCIQISDVTQVWQDCKVLNIASTLTFSSSNASITVIKTWCNVDIIDLREHKDQLVWVNALDTPWFLVNKLVSTCNNILTITPKQISTGNWVLDFCIDPSKINIKDEKVAVQAWCTTKYLKDALKFSSCFNVSTAWCTMTVSPNDCCYRKPMASRWVTVPKTYKLSAKWKYTEAFAWNGISIPNSLPATWADTQSTNDSNGFFVSEFNWFSWCPSMQWWTFKWLPDALWWSWMDATYLECPRDWTYEATLSWNIDIYPWIDSMVVFLHTDDPLYRIIVKEDIWNNAWTSIQWNLKWLYLNGVLDPHRQNIVNAARLDDTARINPDKWIPRVPPYQREWSATSRPIRLKKWTKIFPWGRLNTSVWWDDLWAWQVWYAQLIHDAAIWEIWWPTSNILFVPTESSCYFTLKYLWTDEECATTFYKWTC